MQAALLVDYGHIESTIMPIPECGDDDLLVRVVAVGICGSDLAVYRGEHPYKKPPTVLGHELSGVVERIGQNVTGFALGDRVCCASFSHCGSCTYCLSGNCHVCTNKRSLSHMEWHGAFAEYVLLKKNMTHKIGDNIDFQVGALIEPLTIGIHAVKLAMVARPNKLVVIGAGSIGLSCLMIAKYMGVQEVLVTDIGAIKTNLARQFSADYFVDASSQNIEENILGKLGEQADVTIIASRHQGALQEAIAVTKNGGTIIVVSYFDGSINFDFNTCVRREITIKGSALCTPQDFKDVINLLETKQINPSAMVTHIFSLADANNAMHQKNTAPEAIGKILFTFDGCEAS